MSLSLYFHLPFCKKKCPYCSFYVIPDKENHKSLYLKALEMEWALREPLVTGQKIVSCYFGGGTPSVFPEAVENILNWLPTQPKEITLEANPEDITPSLMARMGSCGINRVSLGVQSLSSPLLVSLGRTHSPEKAIDAVRIIQEANINNISIDLMYELPGQTLSLWEETLTQVAELPITHLSLYNLTIEPHTVFFKKKKSLAFPSQEENLQMLQMALHAFEQMGFVRYEISAFAKGGKISHHNIGYWTARPFLGFGPSAFSYWEHRRFCNIANLHRYQDRLVNGIDPTDFSECLQGEERKKELIAVGLRVVDGIDLAPFFPLSEGLENLLQQLQTKKMIVLAGTTCKLTSQGLLFYDTVASEILS